VTALTDFCTTIRSWLNYGEDEYPDTLVTSFIRMAETTLSVTLRVKHMLQIDTAILNENRVLLPSDWLEADLVRVVGGKILKFRAREAFYTPVLDDENYNVGYFTISGNYLITGPGVTDGATLELHYFQNIPELGEVSNWLLTYYPTLFQFAVMAAAENYARDFEAAGAWTTQATAIVSQLNEDYMKSKAPQGQALKPKKSKGFG
jgi:hypothetical protein